MVLSTETLYAILPLIPPAWLLLLLIGNPIPIVMGWIDLLSAARHEEGTPREIPRVSTVGSQLLVYLLMGVLGYIATYRLVPNIKVRFSWFVALFGVNSVSSEVFDLPRLTR